MDLIKYIFLSFLGLIAIYIFLRIATMAITKSILQEISKPINFKQEKTNVEK